MGAEFSEGGNVTCRGGLHWRGKVREQCFDDLSKNAIAVCNMIACNVYVGKDTTTMTIAEVKRELGCNDRKRTRCSVWEDGRDELVSLGLMNVSETADFTFHIVVYMPDSVRTQNVLRTSNVPVRTSNVPVRTFHVPVYKEVERERKTRENTERVCVREIADTVLGIYPPSRRVSASTFALEFARAAERWADRHGIATADAAGMVADRARSHIDAHRASGDEDRYFPAPRKFFEERIEAEPPAIKTESSEHDAQVAKLIRMVGGDS